MHTRNSLFKLLCALFLLTFFISSCKDDELDTDQFSGLWEQVQITEDGQVMNLSDKEKNLKLLIEKNGVYRSFTKDAATSPIEYYGTWMVTDDKWIDFTTDIWSVKVKPTAEKEGAWGKNHIISRFSILSVADDKMEIRIKTFVGEKKYSPLFVEKERSNITLGNIEELVTEYKTIKTYIFTFKKSSNLQH